MSTIKEIKEISIIEIIRKLGFMPKKEGGIYSLISPWRKENNASLKLFPSSNKWWDFGEGEGGDIIDFVKKLYGLDTKQAIKKISENLTEKFDVKNTTIITEITEIQKRKAKKEKRDIKEIYTLMSQRNNKPLLKRWFQSNHLPTLELDLLDFLCFKDKNGDYFIVTPLPYLASLRGLEMRGIDFSPNGEIIPLIKDGKKVRKTLGEKSPWVVFQETKECLVTESILDALSGMAISKRKISVVSLNGAGNWKKGLELILKFRRAYLALDNDLPGQEAQAKLKKALEENGVKAIEIPTLKKEGVKDLHALLLKRIGKGQGP